MGYKKVSSLESIFQGCSSLISLPNLSRCGDLENIKNMQNLFYGCESLKLLPNISNWKTSNVISIKGMFQ